MSREIPGARPQKGRFLACAFAPTFQFIPLTPLKPPLRFYWQHSKFQHDSETFHTYQNRFFFIFFLFQKEESIPSPQVRKSERNFQRSVKAARVKEEVSGDL